MAAQKLIWILLAIAAVATIAGIWQFSNSQGYKSRGRRRSAGASTPATDVAQRRSDSRQLSSAEKRLYKEAQRLMADGKVQPAARILEQLSMPREAIQALEDHGMIDEAAKILMRMQRHNRAGVVYARHGLWEKAAQCFRVANMPLEVAKCARQAGDLATAAEFFEKVGRHEDAAKACEEAGAFLRAARLFAAAKVIDRAMAAYAKIARTSDGAREGAAALNEQELDQIVDYVADGHVDPGLAALIVQRNRLTEAVLGLLAKKKVAPAAELYLRATADIGPMLMAEVSYADRSAEALAELFVAVEHFGYAGMVYERLSAFDRAGDAFEKAEDFERAAYCYERTGDDKRVRAMKEKAKSSGGKPRVTGSAFALANVGSGETDAHEAPEESTAVVAMPAAAMAPPPPPVATLPTDPGRGDFSLGAMDEEDDRAGDGEARSATPTVAPTPMATSAPTEAPTPRPTTAPTMAPTPASTSATASRPAPTLDSADADADAGTDDDESALPPVAPRMPTADVGLDEGRAAFHRAKFLGDLDFEQKNKIWNIGVTQSYDEGATILTFNDEPRGVYIIVEGTVAVSRVMGGREAVIDTVGPGESFGELWLLADQPTAVRFVAKTAAKLRVVDRDAFTDLLDKDGTIARKVYKKFTLRLLKRLLGAQNQERKQQAS